MEQDSYGNKGHQWKFFGQANFLLKLYYQNDLVQNRFLKFLVYTLNIIVNNGQLRYESWIRGLGFTWISPDFIKSIDNQVTTCNSKLARSSNPLNLSWYGPNNPTLTLYTDISTVIIKWCQDESDVRVSRHGHDPDQRSKRKDIIY
jgi:hypothetical protein